MGRRLGWVLASTIGLAAGSTLGGLAAGAARPLSPIVAGLVVVALYGAVVGAVVGAIQLVVLPWPAVRRSAWVGASALGFGAGFVLASLVGEALGALLDPGLNVIVGEGLIEDLAGAALGTAVAVAQWRAIRTAGPRARVWLAATAIAVGLGYGSAAAVLELLEIAVLKANLVPAYGAIVGLFLGIGQAIVLGRGSGDRAVG